MNTDWLDENDITEMPASASLTYQEFRQAVLAACKNDSQPRWGHYNEPPTFQMLRRCIRAFRHHLVYYAAAWLRSGRYPAAHIYRALRLDRGFTLELTQRERWRCRLMRALSPHSTLRLALPWLRMARTYEGRAFIFQTCVPRPIIGSRDHYNHALDFGIMRWQRFASSEEMSKFSGLQMEWIRSARALGLDDARAMIDWIPRPSSPEAGKLMRLFVRKGVILDLSEKEWVTRWPRQSLYLHEQEVDEARLGHVIETLLQHGVTREQVAKTLCTFPDHWLEPAPIASVLALLRSRGVTRYDMLLDELEYCLFDATPERWMFVLDTLGVRDPAMIVKFRPMLGSSRACSVKLASALIAHGAGVAHLVECQELILKAGAVTAHDPGAALALLMKPPCSLSLEQVPDASAYLCRQGDLAGFLDMLASHGFDDAAALLRFQRFYVEVHATALSRLIALAKPLATGDVVGDVVDWIARNANASHIDSYEYLARRLHIRTLPQLGQVAKVGFLGTGILRYLVEDRGLSSKNALLAWFYERAFGIRSIQHWSTELGPVEKVLFQDAFDRGAFNYWESNRQCVSQAVQRRVLARVGAAPYPASQTDLAQCREAHDMACEAERAALLPMLPRMLEATSGILLAGIVTCAWDGLDALDRRLAELVPLMDDLLTGRGPRGARLNDIEADAIALLYRSTPHTIQTLWSAVANREQDVQEWNLAPAYPMKWRHASWTLQTPLDKAGFEIVGDAVRRANTFNRLWGHAPENALTTLATPNADSMHTLAAHAPHLGILLAIAGDSPAAAAWLQSVPALLTIDDEGGYQQLLAMQVFFSIGLTDALDERLDLFCHSQSNDAVRMLARHLGEPAGGSNAPEATLSAALKQVAQSVRSQFADWASGELAKFGDDIAEGTALLHSVVTKHPSAFFAKEAVKLCTAGNVAMWREARHAHLVVFDQVHQSLQGMALLYREILPALHGTRPALVIRAVNPTPDAMATYHVSSIVDAILSTAVEIARASGCIAVAVPPNTGMHLLSNLDPIAKDIGERYIGETRRPATPMPRGMRDTWLRPAAPVAASFDAYERGVQTIECLYLVWCDSA